MGIGALVFGYVGMIAAAPLLSDEASAPVLVVGHLACLAVLLRLTTAVDGTDRARYTPLLYACLDSLLAEYLIVPLASLPWPRDGGLDHAFAAAVGAAAARRSLRWSEVDKPEYAYSWNPT